MNFSYDPSLVVYLPFYELDGSSFMSRDGYGHIGTRSGAYWIPRGWYFDGVDDKISLGTLPELDMAAITVEAWINTDDTPGDAGNTGGVIYSRQADPGTGANGFEVRFEGFGNSELSFFVVRDNVWPSLQLAEVDLANVWYHVTCTFDGLTARGYVDGVFMRSSTPAPPKPVSCAAVIGQRTGGDAVPHRYTGEMGEVRIYNRALTAPEIEQNYLATKWRYR